MQKEEADELPDAATRDAMGKRLAAEEKRREEQKKVRAESRGERRWRWRPKPLGSLAVSRLGTADRNCAD